MSITDQTLIHMTDVESHQAIVSGGVLRGIWGIFAVPERVFLEPVWQRVVRTGLTPHGTASRIVIPDAARSLFRRVRRIGPYSIWKHYGEVFVSPAGEIALASGVFSPNRFPRKAAVVVYGPDFMFWFGAILFAVHLLG